MQDFSYEKMFKIIQYNFFKVKDNSFYYYANLYLFKLINNQFGKTKLDFNYSYEFGTNNLCIELYPKKPNLSPKIINSIDRKIKIKKLQEHKDFIDLKRGMIGKKMTIIIFMNGGLKTTIHKHFEIS